VKETLDKAQKFNKRVGIVSSILWPFLIFPLSYEWDWWPVPPFLSVTIGGALFLLWIQTERKDFGLVNAGCLLQFAVAVVVIILVVYFLSF